MSDIRATIEEAGPVARTLKITVSPDRVRGRFEQAYRKLQGRAQLKGFRRGKAPRPMLEKVYGAEVQRDVLTELIEEGCAHTIREHGLDIVSAPRLVSHEYGGEGALSFEAAVEIRPVVTLGAYKDLPAQRRVAKVEDAHVASSIDGLRDRMAVLQVADGRETVEAGDIVVFDMFGFEGDRPVPETSGEGIILEVGSGRFPAEFERQMVGLPRGTQSPVTVGFSDQQADEALRGKTIRFEVTVKEIKTKVLPPLDDELAREVGIEGCETLDALRQRVREDLEARARGEGQRRMQNELLGRLVDAHDFALPEELLHETIHRYMHEVGGSHEHDSEESKKLHEAFEPRARAELKAGFILDAIAAAESVEVTRQELEQRVRSHIAQAGARGDEVRRHYSKAGAVFELERNMMREKAAQVVFDSAAVQETIVEESQVADRG